MKIIRLNNIFIYLILVLLISIIFLYYFKNTKNKKQIEAVSLARTEIKTNNPDDPQDRWGNRFKVARDLIDTLYKKFPIYLLPP